MRKEPKVEQRPQPVDLAIGALLGAGAPDVQIVLVEEGLPPGVHGPSIASMGRYDDVEEFWGAILSEEATQILGAWGTLDAEERHHVERHLGRMCDPTENYAEVQQRSARVALDTIRGAQS
jgi:hypothetical protein